MSLIFISSIIYSKNTYTKNDEHCRDDQLERRSQQMAHRLNAGDLLLAPNYYPTQSLYQVLNYSYESHICWNQILIQ